jgi:2-succinyl-5-enolpyruvyl-6-hydroxy-3-cyclohexene-1-carboxylate synthase
VNHPENVTYAYIGVLVDELVRSGVRNLCLCPGSRSTPLAISAARHPGMCVWTFIDERSAGFFALGMAKALRGPVAVLSTSGTAAANFFPAVIEARYGRVPLLVLTADRPRELRDCGAPQTIGQVRLYGEHAKWFVDVAPPEATHDLLRYARALACQAVATAQERPPGPVHLNIPLREPLVPAAVPYEMPSRGHRDATVVEGRDADRPFTAVSLAQRPPDPGVVEELTQDLRRCPRGVIVCGPQDDPALPDAVSRLAKVLGYPILADPLSQVRCGPHDRSHVVDSYDGMLRTDDLAQRLAPDVIVRMGGVPASRPLLRYLEEHAPAHHLVIDGDGRWDDPARLATRLVHADARLFSDALATALERPTAASPASSRPARGRPAGPPGTSPWPELQAAPWLGLWQRLGTRARQAIQQHVEQVDEPFEGRVFTELSALLPAGSTLYVGNSMPVRDLDTFFPGTSRMIRCLGNRGASGIDGVVSSALGTAAASAAPVILVLGDLALYHDLNGLLAAKLHRLRATIVLLNNDGGGIFSFLPQADYPDHFEALFGTPTGLDFRAAAELYDAAFARPATWEAFRACVRERLTSEGLGIVEVRTGRDRNVVLHRQVWAAVEAAISSEMPGATPGRTS